MVAAIVALALGPAQLGWRAGTPEPVLGDNPEWVALYWKAWENLHAAVYEEQEPGPFPPRTIAPGRQVDFDQTLAIALYARWGWRAHPIRETLGFAVQQVEESGFAPSRVAVNGEHTGEAIGPPIEALAALRLWQITGNDGDLATQIGGTQRRYAYLSAKYSYPMEKQGDKPERLGYRVPAAFSLLPMPSQAPGEISAEAAGLILQDSAMLAVLRRAAGDRQAAAVMDRVADNFAEKLAATWKPDAERFASSDDAGAVERDSLAPLIGLIGARLPRAIARDALHGLFDPMRFYRRTLFPTTARTDAAYNGSAGVRPLLSYLALRALIDNGMEKEAGRAAESMLATYALAGGADHALYDLYAAETRTAASVVKPGGLEAGTIVIAGLLEAVIGLDVNAKKGEVTWFLRRTDRNGVKNLRFANYVVTLVASEREPGTMPTIEAECTEPFTLKATIEGKLFSKRFGAGKSVWTLGSKVE